MHSCALLWLFPLPVVWHNVFIFTFHICYGMEGFQFGPILFWQSSLSPDWMWSFWTASSKSHHRFLIRLRRLLGRFKILAFFAVNHSSTAQAELQSLSRWETVFGCSLESLAGWERGRLLESPRVCLNPSCLPLNDCLFPDDKQPLDITLQLQYFAAQQES